MTNEALLHLLVSSLCSHRREITIIEHGNLSTTYVVKTASDDVCKVVGKGGKHINVIKAIFRLIGDTEGKAITVILDEPHAKPPPVTSDANAMTDDEIFSMLEAALVKFWPVEFACEFFKPTNQLRINVASSGAPSEKCQSLIEPLKTLFGAIGKANGRIVVLDFV